MDEQRVRVSVGADGVAEVAMVRADKMNALDAAMFRALQDAIAQLRADGSVRAVVLHGEGRAFCAGLDKARFGEMVIFPAALGCKFTAVKAAYEVDGQHAEVHAEFKLQCAKPLKGATVTFGVSKLYPEIENVEVQAVSETGQTGGTIKRDKGSVKIG